MEINGVNPQSAHARQLVKMYSEDQQVVEDPDQTPAGEGPSEPAPAAVEQTTEDTDAEGVLRLLEQGHFKGVADIRLRINLFNDLAAIEAEKLQAVADEKVDTILQSVGSIVGTLTPDAESPPDSTGGPPPVDEDGDGAILPSEGAFVLTLDGEIGPEVDSTPEPTVGVLQLQETFVQTVNQLKEDFLTAEAPSTGTLVEGIQSAFDDLVNGLESALAPETDDGPVVGIGDDILEPAVASELEPDLQDVIADLRAAFEAAMDGLINGFGEVTILSVVSEPTGNGGAYNKFLNIYNEMRSVDTTDGDSEAPEPLDADG